MEKLEFSFKEAFDNLKKNPQLFRDEKFLNINFGSEILHRQKELKQLFDLYSTLINNPGVFSINQFICGKTGTGKTATVKLFATELKNAAKKENISLKYVHINCRIENTPYKVLIFILKEFYKKFPSRGYSFEELFKVLKDKLNEKKIFMLLVLDDLDGALEKSSDLLYCFTRINEESLKEVQRVSIICILRDKDSIQSINANVRSFFQINIIEFKEYDEKQLFDILRSKAIKAFKPSIIEDRIIKYVVSIVERGDLRSAMILLWNAGKIAESNGLSIISKGCVDQANQVSNYFNPYFERLNNKPKDLILFLQCLIEVSKVDRSAKISAKQIYGKYCELCKLNNRTPRSESQVWFYIQICEKEELFKVSVESNASGKRGRKAYLTLYDASLPQLDEAIVKLLKSEEIILDNKY